MSTDTHATLRHTDLRESVDTGSDAQINAPINPMSNPKSNPIGTPKPNARANPTASVGWEGAERRCASCDRRNAHGDRRNEDRVANDPDPRRNPDHWDRRS